MTLKRQTLQASIVGTVAVTGLFFSTLMQAQALQEAVIDVAAAKKAHPTWIQIPGKLIRPDCVHELPKGASVEVVGDRSRVTSPWLAA